jgi:diguanylate cyclase (GGDEF)-like protein/PAS domain S-box-containing protein
MHALYSPLLEMGPAGRDWLVAANFILSVLLLLWMFGYRRLYLNAKDEQDGSREMIDNLAEGIYRSTLDGRILSANPALARLNGYSSQEDLIAGFKDAASEWYVDPQRRREFRQVLERNGKVEDFVSEVHRHKTRERIWVSEGARLVRHKKSGKPLYYEGSVREITETMKRLKLEEQFQKLTSQLPGGLFQLVRNKGGCFEVTYLSSGFKQLLGIPDEVHFQDPYVFVSQIHESDRDGYFRTMRESGEKLAPWTYEMRTRTVDGRQKWLKITAQPEHSKGTITWHGYIADISVRKQYEMEITELAYYDPLTHLPNRRMLFDRMAHAVDNCRARGDCNALLFVDLDNFKALNDTQGHDVGDAFLSRVAERLKKSVRANDLVARIGGDEFVVLLERVGPNEATATARAITTAHQVLTSLREEFDLGRICHRTSASVGVVVFDGQEPRVEELLKRADVAMYQAKAAGRNGVALFDPATLERETARYRRIEELRIAVAQQAVDLHFQPQIDRDGRTCGAEALLRWNHPEHGLMHPDEFVPLAEQSGLIDDLGQLVLSLGLRQLAQWQAHSDTASLRLAVNVSVHSFSSDSFVPFLKEQLEQQGVDASGLTLELTESTLAKDQNLVVGRMCELKKLGVRFSLDDFGTGYSSLAYLKKLPFDEIKIDGGFVAGIEKAGNDRALVRMVLAFAKTLGLTTVAEHVENPGQEAILRSHGCEVFQGFLYSEALTAGAFLDYVRASSPRRKTRRIQHHRVGA